MIASGAGSASILRGDAAALPLPDASVDLICTSPPYFGLRSYTDGGQHYAGQIGDEASPLEYLDAMIACTAEWCRVLKPGGSLFVNLGDKYSGAQQQNSGKQSATSSADYWKRTNPKNTGIPAKSLMLLPQRYAIRCVDDLGLILRAEIVWAKPNGLPESVTDRVRRSHEQVFHFVKQPRYYSAVDEVREAHIYPSDVRAVASRRESEATRPSDHKTRANPSPLGKLPGSVWTIPPSPLNVPEHLGVDHFAAYPPELVRRIVLGWSPHEVCTACGEGRRPTTEGTPMVWRESPTAAGRKAPGTSRKPVSGTMLAAATRTITGYTCACPNTTAPSTPGVVLDPCGGTGTTALVASVLGRAGITVDMSADYCRLARWRTTDPGERARALEVPKPDRPVDGQLDMFGEVLP